jgi:formate hydrogenlyase subunit 4
MLIYLGVNWWFLHSNHVAAFVFNNLFFYVYETMQSFCLLGTDIICKLLKKSVITTVIYIFYHSMTRCTLLMSIEDDPLMMAE